MKCICNTCGRTEDNQLIVWNKCEQCQRIEHLEKENEQLREALKPFAHPDLCKRLPNNGSDENAVVFIRNQATITLADCNRAARALAQTRS